MGSRVHCRQTLAPSARLGLPISTLGKGLAIHFHLNFHAQGKNKLADHLLSLLLWEREYMQLHRDTTVGALTVQLTLEDGRVIWEDSALVRAVRYGRVLVVDEADKAPLEVVVVLKGLAEDGK